MDIRYEVSDKSGHQIGQAIVSDWTMEPYRGEQARQCV